MKLPEALTRLVSLKKTESFPDGELYRHYLDRAEGKLHKWHHYFEVYERHFHRFRGTAVRFLEIGVQNGGSLGLWRHYFGPQAQIVGVDLDPACAELDGKDAAVRIGDQADPAFLESLVREFGPFDVVLDDGGHTALQQTTSFACLYPTMAEDGVYLCEDTHTVFWEPFRDHPDDIDFLDMAGAVARELTALHAEPESFERFGTQPAARNGEQTASLIAATTRSVTFYDSIVVFERAPKAEPWHQKR